MEDVLCYPKQRNFTEADVSFILPSGPMALVTLISLLGGFASFRRRHQMIGMIHVGN